MSTLKRSRDFLRGQYGDPLILYIIKKLSINISVVYKNVGAYNLPNTKF